MAYSNNNSNHINNNDLTFDYSFFGFRSVTLRNQHSEELELSSLLVYLDMRRQSDDTEVLDPHTALQAGRCLAGVC